MFIQKVLFSACQPVRIADSLNNAPVPYATIKVLHTSKGTIASAQGEFNLSISANDTVIISSAGYQTKQLTGSKIKFDVLLVPKTKMLENVTIKPVVANKSFLVGDREGPIKDKLIGAFGPDKNRTEFAQEIILPDKNYSYKINRLFIPVIKYNCWDSLLIHIYASDTSTVVPGEEIFLKAVEINKKNIKKSQVNIDLLSENLIIRKSRSFFISISWLPGAESKTCRTQILQKKTISTNSFIRSLTDPGYHWFAADIWKGFNNETEFKASTIYSAEVSEIKE